MILYNNRDIRGILLHRTGSVIFSASACYPALVSSLLCVVILAWPGMKEYAIISGSVARIYATILGFVIVFRTNMAFGRFFEGVTHVQAMFSKWRDAFASLIVFIEASIAEYEKIGDAKSAQELLCSKARLLHWFSLMSALAVQRLKHADAEEDCSKYLKMREPINRILNPGDMKDCTDSLMNDATAAYDHGVQVIGRISELEGEQIGKAHDVVLVVIKWILLEISGHSISGRLLIAPPILSRVYQELSMGMLAFFMAMKISMVPFPFPFAQFLQYALCAFLLFCPLAILVSIQNVTGFDSTLLLIPMNFLACAGFVALNEIAVELEDPFGEDDNDYPVHRQQWNLVWALEDCYFTVTPRDFKIESFGDEVVRMQQDAQRLAAEAHMKSAASSADAAKGVSPLGPRFEELGEAIRESVGSLCSRGQARHGELGGLDCRLREALQGLQGEGAAQHSNSSRTMTASQDRMPGGSAGTSRETTRRETTEREPLPERAGVSCSMSASDLDLRELIRQHLTITGSLQSALAAGRQQVRMAPPEDANATLSSRFARAADNPQTPLHDDLQTGSQRI